MGSVGSVGTILILFSPISPSPHLPRLRVLLIKKQILCPTVGGKSPFYAILIWKNQ
ncbi:Ribonuclease BN [Crocosphaera watsonii WH 0401]|uniref:Ribonuclease BN n=1 Tax=Crocosphaera watsonii WH 0401 TaxID=555881 RepID=T2JEW9_CROWT|nr:Ribonuclease BN [Crocosphaera watsonii WH 0401]